MEKERKEESIIAPLLHAYLLNADATDPHQLTELLNETQFNYL